MKTLSVSDRSSVDSPPFSLFDEIKHTDGVYQYCSLLAGKLQFFLIVLRGSSEYGYLDYDPIEKDLQPFNQETGKQYGFVKVNRQIVFDLI